MKFGKIDNVILMGGSPQLAGFAKFLKNTKRYIVTVFSCERQLDEKIGENRETLKELLEKNQIEIFVSDNICQDEEFVSRISETTLAIGFGEVWTFDKKTVDLFNGRLLDYMGIPLPQYRGGAHYTWQILRQNKTGCCNLQLINEDMIQGVFDSGEILKSKEYFFPADARTPQDYFDAALEEDLTFLKEFLEEVQQNKEFALTKLQENFSIYFPRLYTVKQGLINWEWATKDIESFICAFDDPYLGASTFSNGQKYFLKDCYAEYKDGPFHPFQVGLIYRKTHNTVYVATKDGTIVIRKIYDEKGNNMFLFLNLGQRFYTSCHELEKSMKFSAVYDQKGIVTKG